MFRMICQLFYKFFPRFLSFFSLECLVSVAPKPTQTKPKAWPCIACHNYPINRKQAQQQQEWQSQHRLKWYFKKQHKIITLLFFKCLDIIILKQIRTIFLRHRKSTVSLLSVLFWLEISRFIKQKQKKHKKKRVWRHQKIQMINNTNVKKPPQQHLKTTTKSNKKEKIWYRNCNSVLYMASLYKERSKCLVKLPTMQYTVTDTGKKEGEWRKTGNTRGREGWS